MKYIYATIVFICALLVFVPSKQEDQNKISQLERENAQLKQQLRKCNSDSMNVNLKRE